MPPKSRISNLLKNFDFLEDEPEESFDNSHGQDALNALLSKSKKKKDTSSTNSTKRQTPESSPGTSPGASSPERPLIATRSTSQRLIQKTSPPQDSRSKWGLFNRGKSKIDRPGEESGRIEFRRRPSEQSPRLDSRVQSGRRPSEEPAIRRPSEEPAIRRPSEEPAAGWRPSQPQEKSFDYSRFCASLRQMSFNPLFAQASRSDPSFYPESDIALFTVMLEDCLQDSKAFCILPWNIYEEKKDSAIKARSQVQQIQNTLLSSPSETSTTLMIQTLYSFRDLELIILRNLSAVLAYQVLANESKIKDFDSELSSTRFLLKDRDNLISKLEVASKEKADKIVELEQRLVSKQKVESDSDTDVEDDLSSKKKINSTFSISDSDVMELASILMSLDPSLPHPTPSNLVSSLSKLRRTSTFANTSKSDKSEYKEKYLNLEKKYNASKEKLEKYRDDISMWKNRYESELESSKKDNDSGETHAKEIRELKATLRREAEAEISALTEEADREMTEMQESFNARLREAENGFRRQIDDLRKKVDAQDKELKTSKLENSAAMSKNQSILNSEIDKLQLEVKLQYEDQIAELEKRLDNVGLEGARMLERELEKLRKAHELELSSISRKNKRDVDKAIQEGFLTKIDTQNRLDEAQATIEQIKQEASRENAESEREIQSLSTKMNELNDKNRVLSEAVKQADSKYSKQIERLESDLKLLEKENSHIKELTDIERNNAEILKQDIKDKEVYIGELGKSVLEYQQLTTEFNSVEDRYKAELQKKDALIASLETNIQKEKEKAKQGLVDVTEAREEAVDDLDRVKRRLKATEQDLQRAKSFTEEKEAEILDLKRLVRSQNKQLQSALGGDSPSTPKLIKDDLESRMEILNTQVMSLKRQLQYKEKESFEVRMEAAEAFQKAEDLDKAREEINTLKGQIDMISNTLVEVKSAKVLLLERVDNAEHRETLLKNELSLLKAELERKR